MKNSIPLVEELFFCSFPNILNFPISLCEYNKKLKRNYYEYSNENFRRDKYNPEIMKFAITIQGYFSKSYKVREIFDKSQRKLTSRNNCQRICLAWFPVIIFLKKVFFNASYGCVHILLIQT